MTALVIIIIVAAVLIVMNIIGFLSMFVDKRRAINNQWRIKESVLLTIAFFGGGIGSWLGMYTFRHKTKHIKFVVGVPVLTVISYAAIVLGLVFCL